MKSRLVTFITLLLAISLSISSIGCSKQDSPQKEDRVIKLGTTAIFEPIFRNLKDGMAAKGYKVELVMFDANNMPAIATRDGDISGFIQNHRPWIETFNKENNSNLIMMEPYLFYMRAALYSIKYKSLEEIPNGAKIAVPNDPSNLQETLLMMQRIGLLALKEKTENFYTELDIKENPKNIQMVGTEIGVTGRSIADVDAVVCPAYQIRGAGIDPNSYLADNPSKVNYPMGLAIDSKSSKEQWVKDAMEILTSDATRAILDKEYAGVIVLYPKR